MPIEKIKRALMKKKVDKHTKALKNAKKWTEAKEHVEFFKKLGTKEAVNILIENGLKIDRSIEHFEYGRRDDTAWQIIKALGEIGNPSVITPLIEHAFWSEDALVSSTSMEVVGGFGEKAINPLTDIGLTKQAIEIENQRGLFASRVLKRIIDEDPKLKEKITKRLVKNLKHENSLVVAGNALALGELKDKRAMDPLLDMLKETKDKSPSLRRAMIYALGEIGDKKALPHLMKLAGQEENLTNSDVRYAIKNIQEANRAKG